MRAMIILPPNNLTKPKKGGFATRMTPLDACTLSTYLSYYHYIGVLDALGEGLNEKKILQRVEEEDPDYVFFSAFDRCRYAVDIVNKLSEKILAKCGIILGYNCKSMELILKQNKNIDFCVCGDPEYTTKELLDNTPLQKIEGLIYRKNNKVVVNKPRPLIKNLDILPTPDRKLINVELYKRLPHEAPKEPCFDMLASRGCPYQCTYCLISMSAGRNYRVRSPKRVVEEIKSLIKMGAKMIHFQDPVFTLRRQWVIDFCNLAKDLDISWNCQTRTDLVDSELLKKMKDAGCVSILYGVESLNSETLKIVKKNLNPEDTIKNIEQTLKTGIEVRCSLMVGLPNESKKQFKRSVNKLKKLNPNYMQFHSIVAFKGTEFYDQSKEYGKLIGKTNKNLDINGTPFVSNLYKDEKEITKTQREAYWNFYLNPKYIIKQAISPNQIKRNLKGVKILLSLDK